MREELELESLEVLTVLQTFLGDLLALLSLLLEGDLAGVVKLGAICTLAGLFALIPLALRIDVFGLTLLGFERMEAGLALLLKLLVDLAFYVFKMAGTSSS